MDQRSTVGSIALDPRSPFNKKELDLPALAEEDCSYSSRFENRFKPSHRSSSVQKVNSIAILSFLLRPGMKHYSKTVGKGL